MKVLIQRETEYIPEWENNKAESEPIKFVLKALTPVERVKCLDVGISKKGEKILKPDYAELLRRGVVRIENLETNEQKITSAEDVLKTPGLYHLFIEVATQILVTNARQDPKN